MHPTPASAALRLNGACNFSMFPCIFYFFLFYIFCVLFAPEKMVLSLLLLLLPHFNFAQMENNNQGKIIKWTQARKVRKIGKMGGWLVD